MITYRDYLRLVPKIELHCHVVSTIRAERLIGWARQRGVALPSYDPATLFDYDNITDFLAVFNAAHDVFRTAEDFAVLAYEGVQDAVREANLRYREYYVNPDNFAHLGIDYPTVIDGLIAGLRRAEADFGVGFGVVPAINRSRSTATATTLVQTMIANPRPEVLGLGQDDLRADGQESPLDWTEVYRAARAAGLRLTAHVGEVPGATAGSVVEAFDRLGLDRVDHGYHLMDDDACVAAARDRGIHFTTTPRSTRFLSGWALDHRHPIAQMIRAGLPVTLSTDDQVFFRTSLAEEYEHVGLGMGFGPEVIERIVLDAVQASWLDPAAKARLRSECQGALLSLRHALEGSGAQDVGAGV